MQLRLHMTAKNVPLTKWTVSSDGASRLLFGLTSFGLAAQQLF